MAQHGGEANDLPRPWPFEIAGLLFMLAMLWFCAHFALHDQGTSTPLFEVFLPLLAGSVAMVLLGVVVNYGVGRRRHR